MLLYVSIFYQYIYFFVREFVMKYLYISFICVIKLVQSRNVSASGTRPATITGSATAGPNTILNNGSPSTTDTATRSRANWKRSATHFYGTVRRRRKWFKTIRELELQWNDPKTGDTKILWEEIDAISRVLFPIVFFVFAIIYFPSLMML